MLAKKRAAILREYILGKASLPASSVTTEKSGTDWAALRDSISSTDQPWRDEAMRIISETPVSADDKDSQAEESLKNRLAALHGGKAWQYLEKHFFTDMRHAEVTIECADEDADGTPGTADKGGMADVAGEKNIEPSVAPDTEDTAVAQVEKAGQEQQAKEDTCGGTQATGRQFTLLLKTNMLYDIAAVPNLGLEMPIGKHWSVGANWMYAWWTNDSRHRCWRIYGGDIEVRRWFPPRGKAEPLLCGHHIGLYGQMLTYDFEWNGKGSLGDKWSWGVGISYGYSLRIARQLNIDFTLGVGYLQGEYMRYHAADDCHVWDSTNIRKWFGPTKAEISLVWFMGGRNWRKGGAR